MKAIKITDEILCREVSVSIDRNDNLAWMQLAFEVKFGVSMTEELRRKQRTLPLHINEGVCSELWGALKDSDSTTRMQYLLGMFKLVVKNLVPYRAYELNPTMRLSDPTNPDEMPHGEDQEQYEVVEPNPYEAAVTELREKYGRDFVEPIEEMMNHFGVTDQSQLVEIEI